MIDSRPSARTLWLIAALVTVASLLAVQAGLRHRSSSRTTVSAQPASSAQPSTEPPSEPVGSIGSVASVPAKPPVLKLSGPVPTHGQGSFSYAPGSGPVLGKSGAVKHFHIAVERGSGESLTAFTKSVEATLGDSRSWVGAGKFRLRRVPRSAKADFTVYLATRTTAGQMCKQGGTDIRVNGRPYTSCRTFGRAIINLDRWRLSATPYLKAKVPLSVYRHYVINHEVGHELGHGHEGCPKAGGPAPVMVQQTLTLRGCKPYAWPRRNGHSLTGPPV
jgi:hypothetical protein